MNILITERDDKRMKVLEALKRKEISQNDAAKTLGISTRQVRRLLKRYEADGITGIVHKSRERSSPLKMPTELRKKIANIIDTYYSDFGPTLVAEMLAERHNIIHHKEVMRRIMIAEGLWVKQRRRRKHRSWRKPSEYFGQMAQTDGSYHDWFEGRGPWCRLIKFIDDATNIILHAEFAPNESYHSYATASINYFIKWGLPESIYADKAGVFCVNNHNEDNELITQYHANLEELNIELKRAHSPQAKGRIERSFQTDQDRLVKALRLEGISDIETANSYLQNVYISKHNAKFAHPASCEGNKHRALVGIDLFDVFCTREERTVRNDWTIQYKNQIIQISNTRPAIVKPKNIITVCERLDGTLILKTRSSILEYTKITQRPPKIEEPKPLWRPQYRPAKNHPWRQHSKISQEKTGHFHCAKKEDILIVP